MLKRKLLSVRVTSVLWSARLELNKNQITRLAPLLSITVRRQQHDCTKREKYYLFLPGKYLQARHDSLWFNEWCYFCLTLLHLDNLSDGVVRRLSATSHTSTIIGIITLITAKEFPHWYWQQISHCLAYMHFMGCLDNVMITLPPD